MDLGCEAATVSDTTRIPSKRPLCRKCVSSARLPISGEGQDLSKMSEEELQFHYFKLHDNDDNNKLDGLELVKSLIHWHVEEHKHMQVG